MVGQESVRGRERLGNNEGRSNNFNFLISYVNILISIKNVGECFAIWSLLYIIVNVDQNTTRFLWKLDIIIRDS